VSTHIAYCGLTGWSIGWSCESLSETDGHSADCGLTGWLVDWLARPAHHDEDVVLGLGLRADIQLHDAEAHAVGFGLVARGGGRASVKTTLHCSKPPRQDKTKQTLYRLLSDSKGQHIKTQPGSARRLYLQLRSTMPTSPVWSMECGGVPGGGFLADSFVQRRDRWHHAVLSQSTSAMQQFDCHGGTTTYRWRRRRSRSTSRSWLLNACCVCERG
jgi:hypothetical protein